MIFRLRSILFDFFFYTFTTVYLIFFFPCALWAPRKIVFILFRTWTRICLKMLSIIVGLRYTVRGREHLDAATANGPCLIACKHQSAFDTIFISMFLDDIVIISKGQLASVPFFGYYLKKLGTIFIDRENKTSAIRDLLSKSRDAISRKRSLFIFPEGTRAKPGENIPYQRGISLLYRDLNVPVIPVALNTGVFWGRKSMFKQPGMIVIDIQPEIPAGLERDHFMDVLQKTIDTASTDLLTTSTKSTDSLTTDTESTILLTAEPRKRKKKWLKKILTLIFGLGLVAGITGYLGTKVFIDRKLHKAGIDFSTSKIHIGFHTLPRYELSNVTLKSPAIPGSFITAQSVCLTTTGFKKITLEATNINIQFYNNLFSTANKLEAYIVLSSKNASTFNMPYLRMENATIKVGEFSTVLNAIEGNYAQDWKDFDFSFHTPRPTPEDSPILLIKSHAALKDNHTSGKFEIQTTFGDMFINALQQQGMITDAKADELKEALKPIEHESNQSLKQITIQIGD